MRKSTKHLKWKERGAMDRVFKERFIDFMIASEVLSFGDFQTKSGRISPYFINTGNYSTGEKISKLGRYYAEFITEKVSLTPMENRELCLFGPAYKGIPLVVATATALYVENGIDLPYAFNRKEAKDHGEKGTLIGHSFQPGQSILIIEDVITAGTAIREVIPYLMRQNGVRIEGVLVSVDRMEKGPKGLSAVEEIQEEYGVPVLSLVSINDILEIIGNRKDDSQMLIDKETINKMEAYIKKYGVFKA